MSKTPRVRYFAGPEIWTLAQEAYLRGESAQSIAARLNLTENGIRKRAARKGWTRTQHTAALDRRGRPAVALRAALAEVARLIAEGRMREAAVAVSVAEGLARAARAAPPGDLTPEEQTALWARQGKWRADERARLEGEARVLAERMAEGLLTGRLPPTSDGWSLAALRWRARVLGPDAALEDFATGVRGGWASRYWDEHGRLKPSDDPPAPSARMLRQHVGLSRGGFGSDVDMSGIEWPPRRAGEAAVNGDASLPLAGDAEDRGPRIRSI